MNYSLVINSKFRPFSYDEMMKPVSAMYEQHSKIEEGLAELEAKANIWEGLANEQTDHRAYTQYKKYADDLRAAADDLAINGLTARSRQSLYGMKARYASEITPIEQAYQKREERRKIEEQALLKDPTLLMGTRASQRSLDDYLGGNTPEYNTYSGAMITSQVASQMQSLAGRIRDAKISGKLDDYTNLFLTSYGLSPDEVERAIADPSNPKNLPIIKTIVDNVLDSTGIEQWGDQNTKDRARQYAYQGVFSGIGKEEVKTLDDFAKREQLKYSYDMALQRQKTNDAMRVAAYEAGLAGGNNGENLGEYSVLEDNGTKAAYLNTRNALTTGENGALKASYFGKTGKANPMQVYNEIIKLTRELNAKSAPYTKEDLKRGSRGTGLEQGSTRANNYAKAKETVMKKYGVTQVLSEQQYNHLKELGFTTNSKHDDFRYGLDKAINRKVVQYTYSGVNLPEEAMDVAKDKLIGNLNYRENDIDSTSNLVWEMDKNGRAGKPKKPSDFIDFKDTSKNHLTDIYYSMQEPDKVHVMVNGHRFYVSPSAFGEQRITNAVNNTKYILSMSDKDIVAYYEKQGFPSGSFTADDARERAQLDCTRYIKDIVRGYDKGRSKTDSKL